MTRTIPSTTALASAAALCLVVTTPRGGTAQAPGYHFEQDPGRHALVIGNATYANVASLPSVSEDLKRMEERLRVLKFNVQVEPALPSIREWEDLILPRFRSKINSGDIVVVFYSGHGFGYGPHNYLAPADLPQTVLEAELGTKALAVETIEDQLAKRRPGIVLLLIDACRTIGGFVVRDTANREFFPKSVAPHSQPSSVRGVNTLVGYAARQGQIAIGSSTPGKMSAYTKGLVDHIDMPDVEFYPLHQDVATAVQTATTTQEPGLLSFSKSSLYLNATDSTLHQQRRLWLSVLGTNDYDRIANFANRYAVSRHAAAANKWLALNGPLNGRRILAPFTRISPAALERAWSPGKSVVLSPTLAAFGFERSVDPEKADAVQQLRDLELGVVQADEPTPTNRMRLAADVHAIQAHGTVVTAIPFNARASPSRNASIVSRLTPGTAFTVSGFEAQPDGATWLSGSLKGQQEKLYLFLASNESAPRIELGRPLREIVVRPAERGIRDLVDETAVTSAVTRLNREQHVISWVSVATAATDDLRERDARSFRLAHTQHLLKRAGIDDGRITAVEGTRDFIGDGVRVRFFGDSAAQQR